MNLFPEPCAANDFLAEHAQLLVNSLRQLTGSDLLPRRPGESAAAWAERLYHAPFVLLSHNGGTDPVFTYGNRCAQSLFAMPWSELVGLPSRFSAEPVAREERQRLLEQVSRHGYIQDYRGVRIAKTGQRFYIERAVVWNLLAPHGTLQGQAASFDHWTPLADTGAA